MVDSGRFFKEEVFVSCAFACGHRRMRCGHGSTEWKVGQFEMELQLWWQRNTMGTSTRRHAIRTHGAANSESRKRKADVIAPTGQHPEDAQDLLQGQGLQEAHPAQGHPVQGWQGAQP